MPSRRRVASPRLDPRPRAPRAPLSRERIARGALALIDRRGLPGCTMRALGAELGVEAMSLYRHVSGKDGVLDAVVDLLLAELRAADAGPEGDAIDTGPWRPRLEVFAQRFRALARAHPHAVPLLAHRPLAAYAASRPLMASARAALVAAGLDATLATDALRSVVRYVLGFSLVQAAGAGDLDRVPELLGVPDAAGTEELFATGLALMLDGLGARLSPPA